MKRKKEINAVTKEYYGFFEAEMQCFIGGKSLYWRDQ